MKFDETQIEKLAGNYSYMCGHPQLCPWDVKNMDDWEVLSCPLSVECCKVTDKDWLQFFKKGCKVALYNNLEATETGVHTLKKED